MDGYPNLILKWHKPSPVPAAAVPAAPAAPVESSRAAPVVERPERRGSEAPGGSGGGVSGLSELEEEDLLTADDDNDEVGLVLVMFSSNNI